jgi:hypothetical protein
MLECELHSFHPPSLDVKRARNFHVHTCLYMDDVHLSGGIYSTFTFNILHLIFAIGRCSWLIITLPKLKLKWKIPNNMMIMIKCTFEFK